MILAQLILSSVPVVAGWLQPVEGSSTHVIEWRMSAIRAESDRGRQQLWRWSWFAAAFIEPGPTLTVQDWTAGGAVYQVPLAGRADVVCRMAYNVDGRGRNALTVTAPDGSNAARVERQGSGVAFHSTQGLTFGGGAVASLWWWRGGGLSYDFVTGQHVNARPVAGWSPPPVVRPVTTPPAVMGLMQRAIPRQPDGTYATTGLVYRNGILMAEGVDFQRVGGVVRPLTAWGVGDVVREVVLITK